MVVAPARDTTRSAAAYAELHAIEEREHDDPSAVDPRCRTGHLRLRDRDPSAPGVGGPARSAKTGSGGRDDLVEVQRALAATRHHDRAPTGSRPNTVRASATSSSRCSGTSRIARRTG